jgi:hypothetical protein
MEVSFQVGGSIIQDNIDNYTYFIYNQGTYTRIINQDAVKQALKKGVFHTIIEEPDKKYEVGFVYNPDSVSLNEMIVVAVLNSDASKISQFKLGPLNSILHNTLENFLDYQKTSGTEVKYSTGQPVRIKPDNTVQINNIRTINTKQTIIIIQVSDYKNLDTMERIVYYNKYTVKSNSGKSFILNNSSLGDYFVPNDYMTKLIQNGNVLLLQ